MTNELREAGDLSFATKRLTPEGSGCNFEKNSVELGHSTNEGSVSMPVAKEKRDYAKEHELRKNHERTVGVRLPLELLADFDAKIALEPVGEDGKKITRNGLIRKWIEEYTYGSK